ncbi:MAG: citrate lyase acyl carrier protein [Clostridia bacterium]|nr:citrate lyase acyl carrier protein [Clostridia bacterium]MBQ5770197.1 citrate lyase acyl carrier protein [Clostridia bacterium]
MKITKSAAAGSMESNDAMILIEPGEGEVEIAIESVVMRQFGHQIESAVKSVLDEYEIDDARVWVRDKGAVECTLKARTETAILRAVKEEAK